MDETITADGRCARDRACVFAVIDRLLSIADRDRFVAYLEQEANDCDAAVERLQADKRDHGGLLRRLRGDAAALRWVAGLLLESENFGEEQAQDSQGRKTRRPAARSRQSA
jgi:hypothetical protein